MKSIIKKIFLGFFCIIVLGICFAWWNLSHRTNVTKLCAFCDPHVIETHTFYEDDFVRGFCSYKPLQPGHCLVATKRHIERFDEITDEELVAMGKLIKKINIAIQKINGPSAYLLLQKNGKDVGQIVPHVHMHYIPRKATDAQSEPTWGLLWPFIIDPFKRPLSQEKHKAWVEKMKQALPRA